MKKIIVASIVALCTTAQAEFWDGNRLYEKLNSTNYFDQGTAMGYIIGVSDTGMGVLHCAPATATAGQVQDMVAQYLRIYPERRTRTADSIVVDTLKAAWPCANRSNGGRQL